MSLNENVERIKKNSALSVSEKLDKISILYTNEGYTIGSKTENQLQMIKKKTFSFLWAFLWLLLFGVGLIVYLLYYLSKNDEVYTITIPKEEIILGEEEIIVSEEEDDFKIVFHTKDSNTWKNIKTKLMLFYAKQDIDTIVSDKEVSWMIKGKDNRKGYVRANLDGNIIMVESFKLPKPDIAIINSEIKQDYKDQDATKNNSVHTLIELGKLLEKGLITQEEFKEQKQKILN